jgi:hypothetical protein
MATQVKFGMFSSLGRATALAFIEKKSAVQMPDVQRHMDRCMADMRDDGDEDHGQAQSEQAESMDASSDDDDL